LFLLDCRLLRTKFPCSELNSSAPRRSFALVAGQPGNRETKLFYNLQNMKKTRVLAVLAALVQETRLIASTLMVQQGSAGLAAGELAASARRAPDRLVCT
jgi:hypothetical protein